MSEATQEEAQAPPARHRHARETGVIDGSTNFGITDEETEIVPPPKTQIAEDQQVTLFTQEDDGVVEITFKHAQKTSSLRGAHKKRTEKISFATPIAKEYLPDGSVVETEDDRTKSIDLRNSELPVAGDGDGDDDSASNLKDSWKAAVRRRGARKGRSFRQMDADAYDSTDKPAEDDGSEESKRLHRLVEELQLEVYNIELEISQKQRTLDQKRKELRDALDQIEGRPKTLDEMEADHDPDFLPQGNDIRDPSRDSMDPIDSPRVSSNRNTRGDSQVAPGSRRGSLDKPPNKTEKEGVVRVLVTKMNKFTKNTQRVLELHAASKSLCLYKLKESAPQFRIDPSMIVTAALVDKSPLQLRLVFFASSQRLLRTEKDWRIRFETTFERERVFRLIQQTMLIRAPDFVYKPQPLVITAAVQKKVDQLPVYQLAAQLHVVWTEGKEEKGWVYGSKYDERDRTHPEMCPFEKLSPAQQAYDLGIANLTLAGIFELGYDIQKAREGDAAMAEQLNKLIEFLAENAHESWAANKLKQGWTAGTKTDANAKTHALLIPYADMPEEEKDSDREAAITIIASLIKWGFGIQKLSVDV